ncbi:MAG: PocR ligand-binding domain-containing protein [Proteobacteria bacterium]|nr:PocR ligand-binding domain-containing protein [Pseudomonadota bacterium]MBU4297424.1 PocR ligand-binding domain-containing protein [Pseudomonadota bacterium]MCG2749300.1 PocR ligand-binding domain-containing protein [Desulfobulbaceae bacterium]
MNTKNRLKFPDLFDVEKTQELMDGYYAVTKIPTGIIDGDGFVWTANGWLDICTKFHRVNPLTAEKCRESDTYIAQHLNSGKTYVSYRCAHGLTDAASPIIVAEQHIAHIMTGQLLLEKPDIEFFRKQAHTFGFDEEAYLKALAKVPVITSERLDVIMKFLVMLAQFLADMGYKRLKEIEAQEELQKAHATLEVKVEERTAELRAAKEFAEAANRAKSVFLAHMSHELRTPLNAVLGFTQLMKVDQGVTTQQLESLNIITQSGEHLLNLINNILDISKIESGRVLLEMSATDLHQILAEIQSLMHVKANEKGLSLIVEQSADLPRHVDLDAGKLRQVLINLVGNAVKYTKTGGVVLRAGITKYEPPLSAQIRFEVQDSGPGIEADNLDRIFQPFEQLTNKPAAEPGTGLGLTICKQYVELMGGQLSVTSEVGMGSVFSFEIPLTVAPLTYTPTVHRHRPVIGIEEGQPHRRLLIVEDHPESRLLLCKLLEPLGFDVKEAINGLKAVEIFEQWRPDLVWMDVRMPVMDGLEATQRIRSTEAGACTKIIALTAHALEDERREILTSGFDDFIRKPYREWEIFDALAKHLGIRFRYADDDSPTVERKSCEVTAEQLHKLPENLTDSLLEAVELLDATRILGVINRIDGIDHELAESLRKMAENLLYKELLDLLDSFAKK